MKDAAGDYRELTPEEAEAAWADAPEADISEEEMARLWRRTQILCGFVPVAEMTDDELWILVRHAIRSGRSRRRSPQVRRDPPGPP